ncbi:MAG: SRPBCC domain-containing protein [Gemmatimonadales bacterium]
MSTPIDRRVFSLRALFLAAGSPAALVALRAFIVPRSADALEPPSRVAPLPASSQGELTKTAEAIHEDVVIRAPRARVYAALTDAKRFSAMTAYSMVPKAGPATIAPGAGGAFTLFDGHVTGRHIELVPNRRVVQAWRAADWPAGVYSVARFELTGDGPQTTIQFDHTGFPADQGEHLVQGWEANYWTPLRKLLG